MWQPGIENNWIRQEQERLAEKRSLRRCGNRAAGAALWLFAMQIVIAVVQVVLTLVWRSFDAWIKETQIHYLLYYMAIYVLSMGVPILISVLVNRGVRLFPVRRTGAGVSLALVLGGLGLCIAANVATGYVLDFFSLFGIVPADTPSLQDGTAGAFLLNLLIVAVLPAVLEEMLFRGVILQVLRPAGDRAAVWISSLLFALMHTTLHQIPFALLLGLVFGYIVVKTGNIYLSMAIHGLNNAMSVVMEYALWDGSEETVSTVYIVLFALVSLAGIAALAVLLTRKPTGLPRLGYRPVSRLSSADRRRAVLGAPLMVVFIVLTLLLTAFNVNVEHTDHTSSDDLVTSGSADAAQTAVISPKGGCLYG